LYEYAGCERIQVLERTKKIASEKLPTGMPSKEYCTFSNFNIKVVKYKVYSRVLRIVIKLVLHLVQLIEPV
jgi:hypothetical protein